MEDADFFSDLLIDDDILANDPARSPNFKYSQGLHGIDQWSNYLFVNVLVGSFVALCILTFIYRLVRMFNCYLRHAAAAGNEKQAFWAHNHTYWWPLLKRHLVYAPLWRHRHNREFQLSAAINVGTLPGRYHALLLTIYILSNVAYCLVLDYSNPNRYAIIAGLRGRSGVLAAFNLIPTILFALRNNPLIPLLRVSYDTFNLLHRWTARVVIVESIVHTIAWLVNSLEAGGWDHVRIVLLTTSSYYWGLVGTAAFVVIALQAWSPVRHAFYETFLNVHRIMAVAGIIGVYVHLDTHRLPQLPYIKLILLLWALEYFFRVSRILYYNIAPRRISRITVEALPAEACRVTFNLTRAGGFLPGTHVHAYFPTLSLWSSHPFSVAWTSSEPLELSEKLPSTHSDIYGSTSTNTTDGGHSTICLVVRARTGMTRTLYEKASAAPNGTFRTWGALEGPYGGTERLHSFGTVLLFAAGVGITHQLPHVRDLVAGYANGTVAARRVTLIWTVASTEALEWVRPWMDSILRMPRRREILRVKLFITKPRCQAEVVSGTGTVQMFPGRCEPQTIIDRELGERVGAMVVTVCGPGAFADRVRGAVRNRVQDGAKIGRAHV